MEQNIKKSPEKDIKTKLDGRSFNLSIGFLHFHTEIWNSFFFRSLFDLKMYQKRNNNFNVRNEL